MKLFPALTLTALLLTPPAALHAADALAKKPNIVFLLADDMGYMDIGANNPGTFYETPNIDALAAKGVRFTSGYAACNVCSPTRASIMTGKYPPRTGITTYIPGVPLPAKAKPDGVSLAPLLKGGKLEREAIFTHFPHDTPASGQHPGTSVRRGDWKLIRLFAGNDDGTDKLELYNLADDLGETRDLAAEKPDLVRELNALITGFLKDTDAVIPKLNPAFKAALAAAAMPFESKAADSLKPAFTLFFRPTKLRDRSQRFSAWSHSIAVRDDKLVNVVAVQQFAEHAKGRQPMGLAIAESDDGVHWQEIADFACPLEHSAAGYCLRWTGKEFVYFVTERNQTATRTDYPTVMRQHRSTDLKTWEFMGEKLTTVPDKRWYRCRWDELVILDDGDKFYGYITAEPRAELALDSAGMLQSADGVRWEPIPPPVFEWGGLPPQQMEVCFCEKLGGRYYLGMGSRSYMGHLGFSVVMFVSDSATGPFRPDKEAFRLCGNTSRDTSWLAKTFHWRDDILLSNWITTTLDKSFTGIFGNGQSLWIGPLKKLITDKEGHARIVWWPGNDAAKGAAIPVNVEKAEFAHPAPKHRGALNAVTPVSPTTLHMKGGRDGAIALLPGTFDFTRGIILEGTLKATEPRGPVIGTHWLAAAAGFYFEEAQGKGTLLMLETLGLTRSGPFEHQAEPTFDADESRVAAHGNANRSGPYLGLSCFTPEDVIGPLGYAVPCGIRSGTVHHFRLIVRHGIWEIYLDDRYVQTCITGPTRGRLGLFAKNGPVEFTDLRCWAMTPDSHTP